MRYWCTRYHPRVGVRLLVLVVVDNIGSLIPVVQRSPARMGVVSWDGQGGRVQEGSRHPRVPGALADESSDDAPLAAALVADALKSGCIH